MDEQETSEFRFARQVSPTAPLVGHHLATVSFKLGEELMIFWVVEGPQNDAVSFIGIATNFERTRHLGLSLHGSLFERLNQMAPTPYAHGLKLRFAGPGNEPSPVPVQEATAVYSGLRATARPDPDSAAVAYQLDDAHNNDQVMVAITGFQQGWFLVVVVVATGLLLGVELLSADEQRPTEGREFSVGVELDNGGIGALFYTYGTVATRASIMSS